MISQPEPYDFKYIPTRIVFDREYVSRLGEILAGLEKTRALIVCGSNVGANRAVMDPVTTGLGEYLVEIFDQTTPEKRLTTVFDASLLHNKNIDIAVGVGGGSSLNVARAMCSLAPLDRSAETLRTEAHATGEVPSPDSDTLPVPNLSIPTTMPGADISAGGSISIGLT